MRILFVDTKSSTPYDSKIMQAEAIGGTEQSVVRVARGLAQHHDVAVAQLGRSRPQEVDGVHYLPLDSEPFNGAAADRVIVIRKHRLVSIYRRRYPQARIYSWVHNWQRPEVMLMRRRLLRAKATVLTVSDAHLRATHRMLNGPASMLVSAVMLAFGRVPVRRVYNPIDEHLRPDGTPTNVNRVIFLSTPNKGLSQVLQRFAAVRDRLADLELLIAGGTREQFERDSELRDVIDQPGVRLLGRLPQEVIARHVRGALCVFYPQNVHPETFGLIFAEANAVGTPVLAHDFGAAREILDGEEQLVDAADADAVVDKISAWRNGSRPEVAAKNQFRESSVVAEWLKLLT